MRYRTENHTAKTFGPFPPEQASDHAKEIDRLIGIATDHLDAIEDSDPDLYEREYRSMDGSDSWGVGRWQAWLTARNLTF